jgi:type I restriction enzyme S subunit
MVPEGWKWTALKKYIKIHGGIAPSSFYSLDQGCYPYVKVEDMNNCNKYQSESRFSTNEKLRLVPSGSIIFPKRGAAIMGNKVRITTKPIYIDSNMMAIEISHGINEEFLYYTISNEKLYKIADTSTIPQINNKHINPYPVLLPPLPEQKKIARILSTWDKAIETVDKLIENSKQQKKALMQQLLTGKKRLPGFSGEWKEVRLGDVVSEVKRKVDWDDSAIYKLISVKRRSEGLFLRDELLGYKILTKKMNIAKKGDFLISKMQVVHGATGLVTSKFDGMHISDSYIALNAKKGSTLAIDFLNWLSKTKHFYHLAYLSSYGVHIEKMTFNFKLFLKNKIKIPPTIEEQEHITNVLNKKSQHINMLKKYKDRIEKEKQSLMQQLLTGKRRVKVDDDRSPAQVG